MLYSIKLKKPFLCLIVLFTFLFCTQHTNGQEIVEAIHLDENAGGLQVGNQVPNLVLKNQYNTTSNLYGMGGKYVYLHYWASWCPCSQPHITNYKVLFDKYQNANFVDANGFEIYSVSIDEKEMNWREAVEDYGMNWQHNARIQDEQGANELMMWDLRSVPTAYIIDPRGVVIAKNPSLIEMDAILSERSDRPGPRKLGRTVVQNTNNNPSQNQHANAATNQNQSWNNTSWNTANANAYSHNSASEGYTSDTKKPESFTTYNQTDYSNPNYANSMTSQWQSTTAFTPSVSTTDVVIESANVNELKVNVGEFYRLTQEHVDVVKDLGSLQVNNQSSGSQVVIIKGLPNHSAAYEALLEVHKRGFTDAYLTY